MLDGTVKCISKVCSYSMEHIQQPLAIVLECVTAYGIFSNMHKDACRIVNTYSSIVLLMYVQMETVLTTGPLLLYCKECAFEDFCDTKRQRLVLRASSRG